MHKRQCLLAIGPGRPQSLLRLCVNGARQSSEGYPGNRQRAAEKGKNTRPANPLPSNDSDEPRYPTFSKSRHQRAARVSEEVQALSRGVPDIRGRGSSSSYPPGSAAGRGQTVDAEAVGMDPHTRGVPLGGTMGDNDTSGREGPGNQPKGRELRAGEGEELDTEYGYEGAMQSPEEGGAGLMESDEDDESLEENSEYTDPGQLFPPDYVPDDDEGDDKDEPAYSAQHEMEILEQFDRQEVTPVSYQVEGATKEKYLKLGQNGATIAARNYEGVVEDRIKLLSDRTQGPFRWTREMARRVDAGKLVILESEAEKEEVNKMAYHEFAPVSKRIQNSVIDKLVLGLYPDPRATPHQQSILNHVASRLSANGTYLDSDQAKFASTIERYFPKQKTTGKPKPQQGARK